MEFVYRKVLEVLEQGVKSATQETPAVTVYIFSKDGELVYDNDIEGLLQELGCIHKPEEWGRFVDSSKFSLKTVMFITGIFNRQYRLPTLST
jgi:hypothetical protein